MKRRANDSISARTARAAAGRSGEWRPVAPIARRRARGVSTPGCRKYSLQMAGDLGRAAQRGEDVDKAEELDLEALVGHGPVEHLVLPARLREQSGPRTVDQRKQGAGGRLYVGFEAGRAGVAARRRIARPRLACEGRHVTILERRSLGDSTSAPDGVTVGYTTPAVAPTPM